VLPGGGVGLLRARKNVREKLRGANPEQDAGIRIVLRALEEPLRQLARNGGQEPSVITAKVDEGTGNFGWNAATDDYGDLVKMGVLDPCKVTRSGLQNAASIAGLALTTDVMIANAPRGEASAGGLPGGEDAY
jgi:chaperonin GroEL